MLHFQDNIYPFKEIKEIRNVVRAILLDENNKIILLDMLRNDAFGYSKYVETPGGGVQENENLIDALKREIKEELGLQIKVIQKIEVVGDYYNLIYRKNINHYFLAQVISHSTKNLEEYEKIMIQDELHLNIDDAIKKMEANIGGVGELVKQRELPILFLVKNMIKDI